MLSQQKLDRLASTGGSESNRLVFEKSPYLLQHARNPVNWYPWGDEAFGKARQEDKPIFLSIKKRIHPSKDDKILTDWNGLRGIWEAGLRLR